MMRAALGAVSLLGQHHSHVWRVERLGRHRRAPPPPSRVMGTPLGCWQSWMAELDLLPVDLVVPFRSPAWRIGWLWPLETRGPMVVGRSIGVMSDAGGPHSSGVALVRVMQARAAGHPVSLWSKALGCGVPRTRYPRHAPCLRVLARHHLLWRGTFLRWIVMQWSSVCAPVAMPLWTPLFTPPLATFLGVNLLSMDLPRLLLGPPVVSLGLELTS